MYYLACRRDSLLYVIDPALMHAECLAELDHAMYQMLVAASKGSLAGRCMMSYRRLALDLQLISEARET